MKSRMVSGIAAWAFVVTMLGCSSAPVETPATAVANDTRPPAVTLKVTPVPPPPLEHQRFKTCKLGQSCLAMDERPFEPCLVANKRCFDKVKEPLLVEGPGESAKPQTTSTAVPHAESSE